MWILLLAIAGLFVPDSETSANAIFGIYLDMNFNLINKIFINAILYGALIYVMKTILSKKNTLIGEGF